MKDVEEGSKNVYADLGMANAGEMLVKARLAAGIGEIIKKRGLTQMEASGILNMPQSKLSNMLRGKFRGISESKMLECLARLGKDVEIVVKTPPHRRHGGHMTVVFS
ncbi:MAG: XRE family transcriptional regulator [Nitrospinae bacterium]|nr:XRE family transcriptional regulator [Nitrospinota bacterium]